MAVFDTRRAKKVNPQGRHGSFYTKYGQKQAKFGKGTFVGRPVARSWDAPSINYGQFNTTNQCYVLRRFTMMRYKKWIRLSKINN
jgi:hypothetical protein